MKHEYIEVEIGKLKPAKFNPVKRTLPAKLGGLMGSMARHGMPVPIVITEDNEVGDGHRRLACAKKLGWQTVPAVMWNGMTAQEIWSTLNAHQMSMTPAQWLEAVVCGLPIDQPEIPGPLAKTIRELLELLDDDIVWRIVEEGKSPEILKTARFVASKLGWLDENSDERLRRIIQWFLEHDAQAKARAALATGYDDLLAEAIETNQPIKSGMFLGDS
jgi:ParB-like chromosome segregation protein Spo0J